MLNFSPCVHSAARQMATRRKRAASCKIMREAKETAMAHWRKRNPPATNSVAGWTVALSALGALVLLSLT
jgi:hypothetical protein